MSTLSENFETFKPCLDALACTMQLDFEDFIEKNTKLLFFGKHEYSIPTQALFKIQPALLESILKDYIMSTFVPKLVLVNCICLLMEEKLDKKDVENYLIRNKNYVVQYLFDKIINYYGGLNGELY